MTHVYAVKISKTSICQTCYITLYLITLLGTLSFTQAMAAAPKHLQQCLGLPDAKRLACYDQLAMQAQDTNALYKTVSKPNADHVFALLKNTVAWDQYVANNIKNSTIDVALSTHSNKKANESPLTVATILPQASSMERMWELRPDTQTPLFSLQPYKTSYMLLGQHADRINRQPRSPSPGRQTQKPTDYRTTEAKFRISVRSKFGESLLINNDSFWFGYTQISQWQIWSSNISRPFRSTSYMPEVLYVTPIQYHIPGTSWTWRIAGLGLIHESNGQSNPLSRSWNRAYLGLGFDRDNMSIYTRIWARISESKNDDDNPDITHYMGRSDIHLDWNLGKSNNLGLTLASNLKRGNKGSLQVDYFFPLSSLWGAEKYLRGYIQVFHGYGETITDYNFRRTAIGIGVALKEW